MYGEFYGAISYSPKNPSSFKTYYTENRTYIDVLCQELLKTIPYSHLKFQHKIRQQQIKT